MNKVAGAIACFVAAAAGLILYALLPPGDLSADASSGVAVAESRSYVGQVVSMQNTQPVIENGLIKVKLADVIQAGIVGFTTANSQGEPVPVMVLVTPSGHLCAGTAQCACGGSSFSLAGRAVVCETCRSTYDIENLSYLSGAAICAQYPLTALKPVVADNLVEISQQEVLSWRNLASINAEGAP